jgi:hypothetical protein
LFISLDFFSVNSRARIRPVLQHRSGCLHSSPFAVL